MKLIDYIVNVDPNISYILKILFYRSYLSCANVNTSEIQKQMSVAVPRQAPTLGFRFFKFFTLGIAGEENLNDPDTDIFDTGSRQNAVRIYCGPVAPCGPTVYMCFFADLLRIYCGPIAPHGSTVYRYFFADLLLACCTLRTHSLFCGSIVDLIYWEPVDFCESIVRFTGDSLRIYCGSTV